MGAFLMSLGNCTVNPVDIFACFLVKIAPQSQPTIPCVLNALYMDTQALVIESTATLLAPGLRTLQFTLWTPLSELLQKLPLLQQLERSIFLVLKVN